MEFPAQPAKRLALDTDWLTALNAFCGFLLSGALGVGLAWSTWHGRLISSRLSWSSPLLAVSLVYIAVKSSGKLFRLVVLLLAIGPISRSLLWVLRASAETLVINAFIVRWIYVMLCFGCCIYAVYWFKTKVKMSKLLSMREAIADLVPDGSSVALSLQMEQMIPFAAGHEIIRQKKRGLTLIGPISDMLFDQIIAGGCVEQVIAAWVGNVMMGSAYNFRRAVEQDGMKVFNMSNFAVALALQAGAMGVPFLPTKTALGSDLAKGNHFFYQIFSPFEPKETLHAVRALTPDVTIVHVQRADREGNAHCWGNFGVMIEGVRAAKRVIVVAEEIVEPEVIASDPNRTVIPGFLVNAVVECPFGAHPSPVQGYYKRDDAFFRQYHEQTKTKADTGAWLDRWVYGVDDRRAYANQLGACRVEELGVKQHAYAAQADFGY